MIDRATLERDIAAMKAAASSVVWPRILEAAEAHLGTLPKTKMVEVWHVEHASAVPCVVVRETQVQAEATAAAFRRADMACVRVTGPHQQEVPA